MGKFTDRFFGFPIKIYDSYELEETFKEAELAGKRIENENYVEGWMKVPADELLKLKWRDGAAFTRTSEQIRDNGFDCTTVILSDDSVYESVWEREEFESRLNSFWENYKVDHTKSIESGKKEY